MTERIAEKFALLAGGVMTLYLTEAEIDAFPYGVYTINYIYNRTKDGVSSITSTITLLVVSKSFDEADELSRAAAQAVEGGMNGDGFVAQLDSKQPQCEKGIWIIETIFTIKQLS